MVSRSDDDSILGVVFLSFPYSCLLIYCRSQDHGLIPSTPVDSRSVLSLMTTVPAGVRAVTAMEGTGKLH